MKLLKTEILLNNIISISVEDDDGNLYRDIPFSSLLSPAELEEEIFVAISQIKSDIECKRKLYTNNIGISK